MFTRDVSLLIARVYYYLSILLVALTFGVAISVAVPAGEREGCAAARMWRGACGTLVAPGADDAWKQIVDSSPPDNIWHSLRNCVAYQVRT